MKPLGKTQLKVDERAAEIAAAKAVIEARIRLAQVGVKRLGRIGRGNKRVYVVPEFVPQDKTD